MLIDVALALHLLEQHVPSATCWVDSAPFSFHGRWLVEMWAGGATWGSHCASTCLGMLLRGIEGNASDFWTSDPVLTSPLQQAENFHRKRGSTFAP